jgi:hypothetical protein
MPIKFRCSYCRQFLGISRNRAGEVFDCPTCGRTIRVPGLDGSVAPVPEPELNAADAHLARALDELAALADGNAVAPRVAVDVAEAEAEIPQPLPEPEPLELALPPVVTPVIPPGLPPAAIEEPVMTASLADLLPLAATAPAPRMSPVSSNGLTLSRGWLAIVLLAPTAALAMGLGVGWLIGRTVSSTATLAAAPQPAAERPAIASGTVLSGRISFRNEAGETKPDVGAVVIVWPETWDGALRMPPVGLRPADSEADQAAAAALVAGMGGGLTHAAADGSYEVRLSQPGRYRWLVISRLKGRTDKSPPPAAVLSELQQYLADPAAALGERAWAWQPQTVEATGNTAADHVF